MTEDNIPQFPAGIHAVKTDLEAVLQIVEDPFRELEKESVDLERDNGYKILGKTRNGEIYFVQKVGEPQLDYSSLENTIVDLVVGDKIGSDISKNIVGYYVDSENNLIGPLQGKDITDFAVDAPNIDWICYPLKMKSIEVYVSNKREGTDWKYCDVDVQGKILDSFNGEWFYVQGEKLHGPFIGPTEVDSVGKPWVPITTKSIDVFFSDRRFDTDLMYVPKRRVLEKHSIMILDKNAWIERGDGLLKFAMFSPVIIYLLYKLSH